MFRPLRAALITLFVCSSVWAVESNSRPIRTLNNAPRPIESENQVFDADMRRDTLHYDDAYHPNYWTIPNDYADDSLWVRFNPPAGFGPFGLYGALIPLLDVAADSGGPMGTPGISVTAYESGEQDGERGFPTTPIDGVSIPFEDLEIGLTVDSPYNFIDMRSKDISWGAEAPFCLVVSIVADTTTDTLAIFWDNAQTPTDRSGIRNGQTDEWAKLSRLEIGHTRRGYNFSIRAIIVDSLLNVYELDPFSGQLKPFTAQLSAVYPNPFNSSARLSFGVPVGVPYKAALYDPLGRKQFDLAQGIGNGNGMLSFDAKDLTAGVYFVRLTTPYAVQSQRVMLVR